MQALDQVLQQLRGGDQPLEMSRLVLDAPSRAVVVMRDPGGRRVVVKVDTDAGRLEREASVLAACAGMVPVPRVLRAPFGSPSVLVMEHVEGVPLSDRGDAGGWRAAGAVLRRLHGVPAPGVVAANGSARLDAWAAHQRRTLASLHSVDPARLGATLDRLAGACPAAPGSSLLHGDASSAHYLLETGGTNVVGVVDFGNVVLGDPTFDIASLTLVRPDRLDDVISGYGDDDLRRRPGSCLPLYRLLLLVSRLSLLEARGLETADVAGMIEREQAR